MGKLHLISGDDEFAVKAQARALIAELCPGDPDDDPALEIVSGDGDEVKFPELMAQFLSSLRTAPFLSDHQIIWLRNFAFFAELCDAVKGDGAAAEVVRHLSEALPPEQTVVINGPGLDQRKAFVKAVKAAGAELQLANAEKSSDRNFSENRRRRIADLCREAGKRIAPAAAQYLENTIGTDSGTLAQELEKLLLFVGDAPEITLEDCRAIASRTPEAVSWNFTGALVERDTRGALEVLDALIKQGDAAIKVLAAVTSEFQKIIQVKRAMAELKLGKVNPRTFDGISEAAKSANPNNLLLKLHPYRAFKMCESAMRFSDREVADALRHVLDANRALVTGGGEPRLVLEQLIFQITTRPGRG